MADIASSQDGVNNMVFVELCGDVIWQGEAFWVHKMFKHGWQIEGSCKASCRRDPVAPLLLSRLFSCR